MDFDSVSTFGGFAAAGGTALVASLLAALREHRHRRRTNLDRVSLVSWSLLSALFSMLAIILLATAARIYFTSAG
jgi:hypothetical protein